MRLEIDVGVGGAQRDALEGRDRPPELLARARVLGGAAQRLLRDAELDRAEAHQRAVEQPLDDLGAAARVAEHGVLRRASRPRA